MEIELPSESGFTIYGKTGCMNCLKAKALLEEKNIKFKFINSDEYVIENKEYFLNFIKQISNAEVKKFPMIFYNNAYVGCYKEIVEFVDELNLAFDANF